MMQHVMAGTRLTSTPEWTVLEQLCVLHSSTLLVHSQHRTHNRKRMQVVLCSTEHGCRVGGYHPCGW